ncbi:RNase adapter RapZ [Ornithinimicrobium cryptoxanthini]|uniref:RNase adapter RapZ n=1 Tax=Ornithinimicrobium cryptoxanthini TaxID=2934161 RepID=A0ABY4YEC5_9MICO|nr:RNase adapter RapZ [Ornithinimicrobium cryptoxanthini]USQ74929.1 RNase adapter RapZ [Ornithinimicrobium cryptoxanthini]
MTDLDADASEAPAASDSHGSEVMADSEHREFVLITGMSGAGRSTAANVLEDRGWYVVDNIPPKMLVDLVDVVSGGTRPQKLAAVVDVRSRDFTTELSQAIQTLNDKGIRPRTIFVDGTDEALVRRFESVRRPHPLQDEGLLLDGIHKERRMLGSIRAGADVVIDTTGYNVHQLGIAVDELINTDITVKLRLAILSFGFKYGIPLDADVVLDLRFLVNPYWQPELRPFTGRDPQVRDYVLQQPGLDRYLDAVTEMLHVSVDGYLAEGRRYVTVAIGCTGGKHRSVAVTEELIRRLEGRDGVALTSFHRDLGRE